MTVTTGLETSIATAAALHRGRPAGAARAMRFATAVALLARDIVDAPLVDGPTMIPPPGPGLGVWLAR